MPTTIDNKQYVLPPSFSDKLAQVNSFLAYKHIQELTSIIPNNSSEFMSNLYIKLLDREQKGLPTIFACIPAPNVKEITQQVIGSSGYYFKLTTIKTGVDFIWHDRVQNTFLFWGSTNYRTTRALNAIWARINKITSRVSQTSVSQTSISQTSVSTLDEPNDTDYSDMPPLVEIDN